MAKNEPKTPDDVKTAPANEMPAEEKAAPIGEPVAVGEAPAPDFTAEEAAILAYEGEATLRDIGEDDGLEPSTPFDIPAPDDVVVSFEKINELANERKAAEHEACATEDKAPAPEPEQPPEPREAPRNGEQEQRP